MNYYFVYDIETKQEFACSEEYYDKHRKELIAFAIGDLDELREFLGSEFIIIEED